MDISESECNHLKRQQRFDDQEDQSENLQTSSFDGGRKKARFSWQIKGGKSVYSPGECFSKNQGIPENNDETDSDSICITDSCEEDSSIQDNSKYYADQSLDLSHESLCESKSNTPFCTVPSGSRRHSYPMLNLVHQTTNQETNRESELLTQNLLIWQNKHVAKSIVDNAINKTLEEMGVSPETEQDAFMADKSHLENQGISEAIKNQGLVGPSTQNESHSQLCPLLSHLRQASDLVFYQTTGTSTLRTSDTRSRINRSGIPRLSDSHTHMTDYNISKPSDSRTSTTVSTVAVHNSMSMCETSGANMPSNHTNLSTDINQSHLKTNLLVSESNSEIIDQAVSMAISSQGLILQ